jgi:hypothetical protein
MNLGAQNKMYLFSKLFVRERFRYRGKGNFSHYGFFSILRTFFRFFFLFTFVSHVCSGLLKPSKVLLFCFCFFLFFRAKPRTQYTIPPSLECNVIQILRSQTILTRYAQSQCCCLHLTGKFVHVTMQRSCSTRCSTLSRLLRLNHETQARARSKLTNI